MLQLAQTHEISDDSETRILNKIFNIYCLFKLYLNIIVYILPSIDKLFSTVVFVVILPNVDLTLSAHIVMYEIVLIHT
jgi:hypothetical protein